MQAQLEEALQYAEGDRGSQDPRLVKLLQQYGELLIVHAHDEDSRDVEEGDPASGGGRPTKPTMQLCNPTSNKSLDSLLDQTKELEELSVDAEECGLTKEMNGSRKVSKESRKPSSAIVQCRNADADITLGLSMLTRAVHITKSK